MKKHTKSGLAGVLALAMSFGLGSCSNPSSTESFSSDAALVSLNVSDARWTKNGADWEPHEFNPEQTAYDFAAQNTTSSVTVEAQARSGAAHVEGAGTLTLKEGDNSHIVRVTAEDGAVKEYRLTVTRLDKNGMGAVEAAVECLPNQGLTGDMVVNWKPVYGATSYIISYGIAGSAETATLEPITGDPPPTTCTIPGVSANSQYFVWVTAVKGTGDTAIEKSFSVAQSVTAPDSFSFDTLEALKTYLSSLPQNTAKTAYRVKLSGAVETCSRIEHLGKVTNNRNYTLGGLIDALAGKFAYIDISAIKGTELINSEATSTAWGFVPLVDRDKLTGIVLPGELQYIGVAGFMGYSNLTEVLFPDTLKEIGSRAFQGSPIKTIQLPPALEKIGVEAFLGSALETVTASPAEKIPEGVKLAFGGQVFQGCGNLKEVTLPDSFSWSGYECFNGCTALIKLSIPAMATEIRDNFLSSVDIRFEVRGEGNFSTGDNGKMLVQANIGMIVAWPSMAGDVVIPDEVFALAPRFFAENTAITGVTLPAGITYIPDYLFSSCTSLERVVILGNVTSIGRFAFYGCTNLASIKLTRPSEQPPGEDADMSKLPESLQTIGYMAFAQSGLKKITIPRNVRAYMIENSMSLAFERCNSLTEVNVKTKLLAYNLFRDCGALEKVTLAADTRTIAAAAFQNCLALNKINPVEGGADVNFPSGIVEIAGGAFINTALAGEIKLPESLAVLNSSIFDGCTEITKIVIPASITSLIHWNSNNTAFFSGCTGIQAFEVSGGAPTVFSVPTPHLFVNESGTILKVANVATLTLPNSAPSFHAKAFADSPNIQAIALEGEGPLSLADNGHLLIQNGATPKILYALDIDGTLTIPATYTAIGNFNTGVLSNKEKVTSVVFEGNGFPMTAHLMGCTSLTSVTFNGTFTTFAGHFRDCTALTTVTFPTGITTIAANAFSGCTALTTFTIPNSVTTIAANAFSGCTQLTEVILMRTQGGANITKLANISAFTNCTALESIWVHPDLVDDYQAQVSGSQWNSASSPTGTSYLLKDLVKDGATRSPAITYE
jgi:hypothetical protein